MGAAPSDSVTACMTDVDGDGYGTDSPTGVVLAGSDCDDTDASLDSSDNDGDGFSTCTGDCDDTDSTHGSRLRW